MGLTDDRAALEAELKERGFETWQDLFNDYKEWYLHPERPNTYPWSAENSLHEELYIMVRNPYYFGTDPAGNQLPYLNNVHHRLYESQQVLNMRIVSGEIDFQNRHLSMADYTLYKENADKGEYQVFLGVQANHVAMQVNHTTQDEKLREFFQNQKVRIALSLACNRSEINELVYFGLYVPRQYSPLSMSPNYYPKLSNAYIEYDPDEADRLLDEAGYAEKDGDGFRLWKDGSGPVSFIIESSASAGSVDEDAVDLYIKHLAMVGIKAVHRPVERSLYTEHFESNQIEAAWWGGDRTVLPLAEDAQIFLGVQRDRPWAITWGSWRNDPTNPIAEEPPEGHWIKEMWRIWDEEIALEPDEDRQNAAFEKILDIWAEQIPFIGVLGEAPGPVIVKNGFRNYLDGVALDNTTADEHWLQTETYYWEEPDKHTG
jgi:peptide/nickel transport system substrate-binding protein